MDRRASRHSFRHEVLLAAAVVVVAVSSSWAHVFIPRSDRAGAFPSYPGSGWVGEAYLNLPANAATSLLTAENYIRNQHVQPDFTFRTSWIDFPAGPDTASVDAELGTIGDFLDDYIFDVSDPEKLAAPMSHFFLRFQGLLKVTLEDESRIRDFFGVPIWVDFGTMGYDGYRLSISQTSYRTPDVNLNDNPWVNYGPSLEVQGLYPIEVACFNRYDPKGILGAPYAGIELYSYHGSDKAYPAGEQMFHPRFGFGTLTPPTVIYQPQDVRPLPFGDFNADSLIDMKDAQWLQSCGDPTFLFLPSGCDAFDFDNSGRISTSDIQAFLAAFKGPADTQPEKE